MKNLTTRVPNYTLQYSNVCLSRQ